MMPCIRCGKSTVGNTVYEICSDCLTGPQIRRSEILDTGLVFDGKRILIETDDPDDPRKFVEHAREHIPCLVPK